MLPFIDGDLSDLVSNLQSIVCTEEALSMAGLPNVPLEKDHLCDPSSVEIGIYTQTALLSTSHSSKQKHMFRNNLQICVIQIVNKIKAESPLNQTLVRHAKWLKPSHYLVWL